MHHGQFWHPALRVWYSSKGAPCMVPPKISVITRPRFYLEDGKNVHTTNPLAGKNRESLDEPSETLDFTLKNASSIERKGMVYRGVNALKRLKRMLSNSDDGLKESQNPSAASSFMPEFQKHIYDAPQENVMSRQPILLSNEEMETYLTSLLRKVYGADVNLEKWRSISLSDLKHKFFIVGTAMQDLRRNIHNTDLLHLNDMDALFSHLQQPQKAMPLEKGNPIREVFAHYLPENIPRNLATLPYQNSAELKREHANMLKENYQIHLSYLSSKRTDESIKEPN